MSERIHLRRLKFPNMVDCGEIYKIYTENIFNTRTRIHPTTAEHLQWFLKVFDTEELYLIESPSFKIGYIRINKKTKEISIALKKVWQDMTIGSQALELLENKPLIAKVHKDNVRSIHFFKKHDIPVEVLK